MKAPSPGTTLEKHLASPARAVEANAHHLASLTLAADTNAGQLIGLTQQRRLQQRLLENVAERAQNTLQTRHHPPLPRRRSP